MFRHRGKSRKVIHNLKLASLLSFVAGMVNVSGLFAIQRLTTNVTGHFAFFADELVQKHFAQALVYLLYILAFFSGAFCSSLFVEFMYKRNSRLVNSVPVIVEIGILTAIACMSAAAVTANTNIVACLLLFAMGLQNALVTSLSNSVVRTTHLTGLFTDLGIELSQVLFFKEAEQQKKLFSSIRLRLTIICFFFLGGLAGGFGYFSYGIRILLAGAFTLFIALIYDTLKLNFAIFRKRYLS